MRISGRSPRKQMQLEWRGPSNGIDMIPVKIGMRIFSLRKRKTKTSFSILVV